MSTIPSPVEIVAELDKSVFAQDNAKRVLACAIYKHLFLSTRTDREENKLADVQK
jgi:ATP-dependent protease Clp ATPase subunit